MIFYAFLFFEDRIIEKFWILFKFIFEFQYNSFLILHKGLYFYFYVIFAGIVGIHRLYDFKLKENSFGTWKDIWKVIPSKLERIQF